MRLRRKGQHWYLRVRRGGRDTEVATGCTDKKAAEAFARRWERDDVDPEGAARRRAESTSVTQLVEAEADRHDANVKAGRMAPDTRDFYRKRLGTLLRWFGADRAAVTIDAATVDAFIAARRAEGASDHTVHKELGALRRMLDGATRAGTWCGDVRRVMPRFAPNYTPRERFLTIAEVRAILDALSPGRGAWVALAAGAGAELAALKSAQRDDFDRARRVVMIRGTKNARRHRAVPLVLPVCAELVERAFADGDGDAPLLLRPWSNNRRDLHDAARKASVEPFSLHSLRHSFATWHLAAGASFDDVARAMGHAGTAMLHRVYGHLSAEELRARLAGAMDAPLTATTSPDVPRYTAHGAHRAHSAHTGELHESRRKQRVSRVPRDGIEPPTRGFSVPCSTN